MAYVFMSFASLHTGKNIGCCIVKVDDPDDANERCRELGLMPDTCNQGRGYLLPDEAAVAAQGMEVERFYTDDEMLGLGFTKSKVEGSS
jgi:N-acetylglutamate synthase-like GNAT family acetyltransferase